jgi:ATP-binding protein involved in chromosome partitioning
MPPGISDTTMDTMRLLKRAEFLIVATPSRVALETVEKTLRILKEMKIPVIGVIENMKIAKSQLVEECARKFDLPLLGEISFDHDLEESIGDRDRLLNTSFTKKLRCIFSDTSGFRPN